MSASPFKIGPRYRFKRQVFWSEGGQICIENQDDGDFKVISRAEAAARAVALNAQLRYMNYADERDEVSRCVVNLCEAVKEAKRQGDPDNPEVRKQRINDMRKVSLLRQSASVTPNESEIPAVDLSGFTPVTKHEAAGMLLTSDDLKSARYKKLRL